VKVSKWALALLASALFSIGAEAATSATVTQGTWDLYRQDTDTKVGYYTTESACVNAAKAINATRTYTCRHRTTVKVTYTSGTGSCGSRPADESRTQTCPAGTTGTWTQSRTYASAAYPTCWTAGAWSPSSPPSGYCPADPNPDPDPTPPPTGATYTDLASAPTCARVTVYPAKTVTNAAGAGIPTHTGRCLEATPSTFNESFWAGVKPGDVVTLRAGTYTTKFGEGTWYYAMGETYKHGTAAQPIAVVAYPGEVVTFKSSDRPPLMFGNGSQNSAHAEYLTFAGINIIGATSCMDGGGDSTDPSGGPTETGGRYIRLVGINCTITDSTSNTMTGLFQLSNDGWKVLGNTFRDPSNRVVINNNHGVYIQGGADDVEVAYNDFQVHTGHVVQIHQDGTPKLYERLNVHDNTIHGVGYGDMRGISMINVDNASTATIAGNKIYHQGQGGWGCFNIYRGVVALNNNQCTDSQGGLNLNGQYGGTRKVTASGNKICPLSGYERTAFELGATSSQLTETGAKSCN